MRLRIIALTLCCLSLAEPDVGKLANGESVNCSTRTECLALLRDVTAMRHQKEAEAYSMLGYADKALRQASSAEGLAKASLAETEDAEAEAVRWSTKVQELEDRLRSAQQDVAKSAAAAQDAKTAEKRAEAAQAEAIREKKHQSALSSEPAKERCLEDFASCTAGLAVLQLEQWMAMLHINRFFVSLVVMAVGTGLLLLPARAQAASFAVCALVVLPVLLAGAFREFLRFVASSPPSELLGSFAGLLTAVLAFAFLWQGADGLRLLLGAALAVLLGDLVLVASWLPLPEALAALAAMALGYAGAAAGLYRRRATQAFAMAVPAALLLPAGFLLFLEALGRSEAYLDDIVSALLPWADKHSEKVVGSTFCEYGRLAWLLLQLPALVHLLTAPGMDVAPFPWESEEPAKTRAVVPAASPPEEPEETETNADKAAEAAEAQPEVAVTPVPSMPSQPAVPEPELEKLDPVATTELLQKTVAALQALETALSPKSSQARASEAPPATILAAANAASAASAALAASAAHGAEGEASNEQ